MTSGSAETLRAQAREGRMAAVRRAMAQEGIELLVAYGSGRHRFLGANACWYLSGLRQVGPDAVTLLPLEGEPALIVTPAWDAERARRTAPPSSPAPRASPTPGRSR